MHSCSWSVKQKIVLQTEISQDRLNNALGYRDNAAALQLFFQMSARYIAVELDNYSFLMYMYYFSGRI